LQENNIIHQYFLLQNLKIISHTIYKCAIDI